LPKTPEPASDRIAIATFREAAAAFASDDRVAAKQEEAVPVASSHVPSSPSPPAAIAPTPALPTEGVKRTNLQKTRTSPADGSNPFCPVCHQAMVLEARENKQKWVCHACGHERKKR